VSHPARRWAAGGVYIGTTVIPALEAAFGKQCARLPFCLQEMFLVVFFVISRD